MNQGALLFPMSEPEEHILLSNAKSDFSSSDIDPCPGGPQEWSPKYEFDSEVAFYVYYHKIGKDKGVSHSHQDIFDYPFGISNCRICELHTHICWGKSMVLKSFKYYRGHNIYAGPQIAKCVLIVLIVD